MTSDKIQAVPKVSAIITTHNRKELVDKAIDSVLKQTYNNIELLVVDDASNDGTKEILSDRSVKDGFEYIYIPKEESKGGNYARNVGINHSKGEYIAFLDDDDEWMPGKIEKQVDFLVKHEDYGVVSCLTIIEYDLEKTLREPQKNRIEGDIHLEVFQQFYALSSSIMIRYKLLEKCGFFDENLGFWQDYELSIRFAQITKAGIVPEYLMLYRIIGNSNSLTNNLEGWEKAVEYIENKHKDIIDCLPPKNYRKHIANIANDGLQRSIVVRNKEKKKKYLIMLLRNNPSLKVVIKVLIGMDHIKKIRNIKARFYSRKH